MPSYLGGLKMASCPLKRDVFCFFFYSKPDQNKPSWNQKWNGNMLQHTRLQRNKKSDDNITTVRE